MLPIPSLLYSDPLASDALAVLAPLHAYPESFFNTPFGSPSFRPRVLPLYAPLVQASTGGKSTTGFH